MKLLVPLVLLLTLSTGCEEVPSDPVVEPTIALDADSLLSHYRKTVPPLSADWQGISKWTTQRSRLEQSEAMLLAENERGGSPEIWAELGRIYTEVGEYGRGLWFLSRALEVRPDDVESWVILGNNQLGRGEAEQALCLYERAIELNRDHTFAWARSGEAHLLLENTESAETAFKEAVLLSPRNLLAQMGLARLYEQIEDFEQARAHLEAALRVEDDEPTALFRLARVLRELGLTEEALAVQVRHERAAILEDKRLRKANLSSAEKFLVVAESFQNDSRLEEAAREYQNAREAGRTDAHRVHAIAGLLMCARAGVSALDSAQLETELRALAPDHELLNP